MADGDGESEEEQMAWQLAMAKTVMMRLEAFILDEKSQRQQSVRC